MDWQSLEHIRRLLEHPDFAKQVRKFLDEIDGFRKVYTVIREDLKYYAHVEAIHISSGYYYKITASRYNMPSFTYYFKFDDSSVTAMSIELNDEIEH